MKSKPDGGWAWVVAVAACIINFIMAGLGRMSGILYVTFIDMFDVTRKEATTPFSIRSSTRNLLGPIVGILGQQYGVRAVTLAGGVVAVLSAVSCYFANDMLAITLLWGGFNGIGTALTTTLPQVVIGQHFKEYRTTASGMAFSGGCVGSFLFPVLLEYLLKNYGLQGTFLIIAGIIMHALPCAMILRKPDWIIEENNTKRITPVFHIVVCSSNKENDPNNTLSNGNHNNENINVLNEMNRNLRNDKSSLNADISLDKEQISITDVTTMKDVIITDRNTPVSKASKEKYCNSEKRIDWVCSIWQHIKTSVKLYMNPMFVLICLCRATHFVTFIPVVTVIVDFGMDKGLFEHDGKYIIAALSLGDLIGRLCLGWITDKNYLSLPKYMTIIMMVQGVSTASLGMISGITPLFIMVTVFGILQGSLFIRHPVLVSRYMGVNEQSIAMGSINFLSGVIGFSLPGFIGYFRDTLGSYNYMFFVTGGLGFLIGIVWILEPFLTKFTKEKEVFDDEVENVKEEEKG